MSCTHSSRASVASCSRRRSTSCRSRRASAAACSAAPSASCACSWPIEWRAAANLRGGCASRFFELDAQLRGERRQAQGLLALCVQLARQIALMVPRRSSASALVRATACRSASSCASAVSSATSALASCASASVSAELSVATRVLASRSASACALASSCRSPSSLTLPRSPPPRGTRRGHSRNCARPPLLAVAPSLPAPPPRPPAAPLPLLSVPPLWHAAPPPSPVAPGLVDLHRGPGTQEGGSRPAEPRRHSYRVCSSCEALLFQTPATASLPGLSSTFSITTRSVAHRRGFVIRRRLLFFAPHLAHPQWGPPLEINPATPRRVSISGDSNSKSSARKRELGR
jgi:hypothetical protein